MGGLCRSHDRSNEVTCSSHDHVSNCSKALADDIHSGTVEEKLGSVRLTERETRRVLFRSTKGNSELQDLNLDRSHRHGEVDLLTSESGTISAQNQQEGLSDDDCTGTTDFSYEGDFNFSDLMDQSLLVQESHDQSIQTACKSHDLSSDFTCSEHNLNRYLVLESTTQEYMEGSAALNTWRYAREFITQTSIDSFPPCVHPLPFLPPSFHPSLLPTPSFSPPSLPTSLPLLPSLLPSPSIPPSFPPLPPS